MDVRAALHRVPIYVLLLAGMWAGFGVWMHHYALADAVDAYHYAVRNGDVAGGCREATKPNSLYEAANDGKHFEKWRDIARAACD